MHANEREEVEEVFAGDIVAFVGLKNTSTGHTLCDEKNQLVLEKIDFPEPVILFKLNQKQSRSRENGAALKKLQDEDPTFKMRQIKNQENKFIWNGRTSFRHYCG
jgi:elongation factor G